MKFAHAARKWFTPGLGIKRWVILVLAGVLALTTGLTAAVFTAYAEFITGLPSIGIGWIALLLAGGTICVVAAVIGFSRAILAPYRFAQPGAVIDVVTAHSRRGKGPHIVAIGGGTGLPATLRALKPYTSNLTAVVTVADDGGSSGRLRHELGVLPPGDLRNNIAALSDDESLMTRLFQYRFSGENDLGGHAFGNLFIGALSGVTGSLETALVETERVLNIQGRVLPATLQDVTLSALIRLPGSRDLSAIHGESRISAAGGDIEEITLNPADVEAYAGSVRAILEADLVIIGPGSLYTSILPNLLVKGIADALRATSAYKIYICNVATQPGETEHYTVAEHVLALERHIGRGVFQTVLANNAYPTENAGVNTHYVPPAPANHEILQRYDVRYTDLVDSDRPWRHDPQKIASAIASLSAEERIGGSVNKPAFASAL